MVLVGEVAERVVHVLGGVDHEILLLLVLDVEEVALGSVLVLVQVSREQGLVPLRGVAHEQGRVVGLQGEDGEDSPAESPAPEEGDEADGLEAEVE